jgi:hypothetical protein
LPLHQCASTEEKKPVPKKVARRTTRMLDNYLVTADSLLEDIYLHSGDHIAKNIKDFIADHRVAVASYLHSVAAIERERCAVAAGDTARDYDAMNEITGAHTFKRARIISAGVREIRNRGT